MGTVNILLVEDDIDLRLALRARLQKQYNITEAPNGKVARDLIALNRFDVVLSDIRMPHFNGLELADWIKHHRPTPTVLISAHEDSLKEGQQNDRSYAFLKKPFAYETLLQVIEKYLPKPDMRPAIDQSTDLDAEFCKIPLESFISEKQAELNIFVRVSATKYVRIAHQGGIISPDRIEAYKNRDIKFVYVKKEDFTRVLQFNMMLAKAVKGNSQLKQQKKAGFMKNISEIILENVFVNGVNRDSFHTASDFVVTALDVITDHDETLDLMCLLRDFDDTIYAHCLGVSTFSVMIARAMGWQSVSTLAKLAIGGLLHDVGEKELDPALLKKPRPLLTQVERKQVETHTTRGKEILASIASIPTEVVEIAYQHHEDNLGQGFPRQLTKNQIHPLARVVHLADVFCDYTVKPLKPTSPAEAVERIKLDANCFDTQALAALEKLVRPN